MRGLAVPAMFAASLAAAQVAARTMPQAEREQTLRDAEASHIAGNVVSPARFDRALQRDLRAYFRRRGIANAVVRYALLRQGPTQTGIAYPKYYLWAWVWSGPNPAQSGAVRVAAVERQSFEVTDFVDRQAVLSNPDRRQSIFPAALVEAIRMRAASVAFPRQ
jgi:hypothetical protein